MTKDDTLYIPKCDSTDDCSIPEHDEQADTLVAKNAKRDDLDFRSDPLTTGHRLGRRSCFDRNLEQKGGNGVLSYRDQFISQVSVWYLRVQTAGIQYVIRKFQGQLNFVPNIPGVTNDQSFQVDHCFELWIIKQFAYDAVDAGWFPGYNHDFYAATHSPDVSITSLLTPFRAISCNQRHMSDAENADESSCSIQPPPQLVAFLNSNFNLRGVDGRVNKLKNVVLEVRPSPHPHLPFTALPLLSLLPLSHIPL